MRGLMSFVNSKCNLQGFICICNSLWKFDYTFKQKDTSKTEKNVLLQIIHLFDYFDFFRNCITYVSYEIVFFSVLIGNSSGGKYDNNMELSRLSQ